MLNAVSERIFCLISSVSGSARKSSRFFLMSGTPGPGQLTAEEIDAIRAWLAEQDHTDIRVEQLEERLDFVERVLGRTREAQRLDP